MKDDPYEQNSLVTKLPEKVSELQVLYEIWNRNNMDALWEDPHVENVEKQEKARLDVVRRASAGEKK